MPSELQVKNVKMLELLGQGQGYNGRSCIVLRRWPIKNSISGSLAEDSNVLLMLWSRSRQEGAAPALQLKLQL